MALTVGDYTILTKHSIDSHLTTRICGHEDFHILGGKTLGKQLSAGGIGEFRHGGMNVLNVTLRSSQYNQ